MDVGDHVACLPSSSWVVFEKDFFCGEMYVLEKGLYTTPEDWGSNTPKVASAMPVALVSSSARTTV